MARKLSRSSKDKQANIIPDEELDETLEDLPEEKDLPNKKTKRNDQNLEELTIDKVRSGYDIAVHDFLLRNELLKQETDLRVYKFQGHNSRERVFCGKYLDHIPDEDEIGKSYGAGKYECMLTVSDNEGKRRITSSKFTIAQLYDDIREQEQMKHYPPQVIAGGGGGSNYKEFDRMIDAMSKFMGVISPLINNNQNPDLSAIMMKNYQTMGSVMQKSALDQQQMLNDMQRSKMGLSEVVDDLEESTGLSNIVASLAPWIEKLLPLILGGGNQGKAAVTMVKAAPQFKKVVKNKHILAGLIKFIEKKHGKEEVKKLLSELKIRKPRIEIMKEAAVK